MTARAVVSELKADGLPIGRIEVYTGESDPNHLLGRPGGYASKANFADRRLSCSDPDVICAGRLIDVSRGGSVEVFPSEEDADARTDYLSSFSGPFVNEYFYLRGKVLLRVSGILSPAKARVYKQRLFAMALEDNSGE